MSTTKARGPIRDWHGMFDPRNPCGRGDFFVLCICLNLVVYAIGALIATQLDGFPDSGVGVTDTNGYAVASIFGIFPFVILYIRRARSARIPFEILYLLFGSQFLLGAMAGISSELDKSLTSYSTLIGVIGYWVFLLMKPKVFEYGEK